MDQADLEQHRSYHSFVQEAAEAAVADLHPQGGVAPVDLQAVRILT